MVLQARLKETWVLKIGETHKTRAYGNRHVSRKEEEASRRRLADNGRGDGADDRSVVRGPSEPSQRPEREAEGAETAGPRINKRAGNHNAFAGTSRVGRDAATVRAS